MGGVVYYSSTRRDLKRRLTYVYPCDETLKTKTDLSTSESEEHGYWEGVGVYDTLM